MRHRWGRDPLLHPCQHSASFSIPVLPIPLSPAVQHGVHGGRGEEANKVPAMDSGFLRELRALRGCRKMYPPRDVACPERTMNHRTGNHSQKLIGTILLRPVATPSPPRPLRRALPPGAISPLTPGWRCFSVGVILRSSACGVFFFFFSLRLSRPDAPRRREGPPFRGRDPSRGRTVLSPLPVSPFSSSTFHDPVR